jgi:hypothetical protein
MSRGSGNSSIDALGELEGYEGNARPHEFKKPFIELPARFFQDTHRCLYAVAFEGFDAFACDYRIGIRGADDYSCGFSANNTFYAGRRFPVMSAGFKVNINGRALDGFGYLINGIDFGVVAAEFLMIPLSDNPAPLYNNSTHHGVGTYPCFSSSGKPEGPFHIEFIHHNVSSSLYFLHLISRLPVM